MTVLRVAMLVAIGAVMLAAAPVAAEPISYADLLARPRPNATERIRYGDAPSQFVDLWLPATRAPYRVVVMLHGGCWRADLPGVDLMAYAADALRQRGFAVVNVEYRRLGEPGGGYPGTFEDVAKALDSLRRIAAAKQLDLGKVIAIGHSAGGHLALWAAARRRLPKASALYRGDPLPLKGVISLAGIADLSAYRGQGPSACGGPGVIDQLVGRQTRGPWDMFTDTSPAEMLPLGIPQMIVSGALDPIVPAAFGRAYAARAVHAGDAAQDIVIADAGHFELIDPQSAAFAQIAALLAQF